MQAHTKLWDMIHDIRFAMVTSRGGDGRLQSRPLTTQNRSLDADELSLWFFVSRGSEVAADIGRDPTVNVSYADADEDRYVSIAGSAELVNDQAQAEALWSVASQAWFPGGPADPSLQLVRVRVEQAEYWDVKSSKMVQLLKMAKAAVTGTPPKMSEHRELH